MLAQCILAQECNIACLMPIVYLQDTDKKQYNWRECIGRLERAIDDWESAKMKQA